jgi:outer membrane protein assembly factor BamB
VALIAVGALALSSCDWAQPRFGPEGTGSNPFESTIGVSNVSALQEHWSETLGIFLPGYVSPPVVAGGVVYASTCAPGPPQNPGGCARESRLDALDAATGSGKWTFAMRPNAFGNGSPPAPAVANGVVYDMAGSTVYAVDATTGTLRWSADAGTGDVPSALVVASGVVYVASGWQLLAYDASTGALVWSSTVGVWNGDQSSKTPAVANGVVYTTLNGQLSAYNASTGTRRWAVPQKVFGGGTSPAVAGGVVYVTDGSTLFGFDATTGALAWSAPAPSGSSWQGSPAVANGVVYLGAGPGNAHLDAFNAATGAPIWSATDRTGRSGSTTSSPVVANGVVYLRVANWLDAFNATTGAPVWSGPVGAEVESPVVVNGALYTSAEDALGGHIETWGLPVNGAALTLSTAFPSPVGTALDGTRNWLLPFNVTNFGNTATPIAATFTGADPSQFQVYPDPTCAPLASGASCPLWVAFTPTLPGVQTANLVVNGADGSSASASLTGTGSALSMTPSGTGYGRLVDGTTSAPTTFTVTNHSAISVNTSVAPLSLPFTAPSDTCSGATLAPSATCNVRVEFQPSHTDSGDVSASLTVTSTPGISTSAALFGTAVALDIEPATKDYGTVPVGSSSTATFTMTDMYASPLTPASIVTGNGFSITSNGCAGIQITLGTSCTFVVAFTPSSPGTTYNDELTFLAVSPWVIGQATLVGKGG